MRLWNDADIDLQPPPKERSSTSGAFLMLSPMSLLPRIDAWQRRTPAAAVVFGVLKKFSDDSLNQYAVALAWYGFLAIYPLLLVVVTVLGFIGVSSLGTGIVQTLHQ